MSEENNGKIICFDFDGVIAKYDGWKGADVFGAPHWDVVDAMKQLKAAGYRIIIWTTRKVTPALKAYLQRNNVPYESINSCRHNPPGTSGKPIYHVFIDDRAIGYRGQKSAKLIRSIEHLIANGAQILAEDDKKEEPVLATVH
jgi:hydroxymethylpyrimidine pyrophosphatase-like HAD family hydrolase